MKTLRTLLVAIGLAAVLVAPAFAADKIITKDGREYVGDIVKKTENFVQIRVTYGSLDKVETIFVGDIVKIEEDTATGETGDDAGKKTGESGESGKAAPAGSTEVAAESSANEPRILLLPLTGMVGVEFRHEEFEKVAERAAEIENETGVAPIIVLEIESGGGIVREMHQIHETLTDLKKRHRVVAWIKEAISAACATAIHCDEIYYRTEGNAGAMTMWAGGVSVKGPALQEWLNRASRWAEIGGHDPAIVRAMIHAPELCSYDVDRETGEVTVYDDLSGEYVLSREDQNLSLTSSTAVHCGFADGIADTREQLAELLNLESWNEDFYARELHEDWIATIERGRKDIPKIIGRMQLVEQSNLEPIAKIGRQIDLLKKLVMWWDLAPNLLTYELPVPPKEVLERQIRQLQKQASDLRRNR